MDSNQQPAEPAAKGAANSSRIVLPWVVTGVLAVVCAVLLVFVIVQASEISQLRSSPSSEPAAAQPPGPDQQMPQPVTDPEGIKVLKSLPRRQADDPMAMGKVDAPVVMTFWTDPRCPFCSKWERETLPALRPYVDSGSLRIEHRDLVIFGEQSEQAAIAARAAGTQGKYWQFREAEAAAAPLQGHPDIDAATLVKFAKEAGVTDIARFEADLKSPELKKLVSADTAHGQGLGIEGTPFFIINTTQVNGAYPTEVFTTVIERESGKK